MTIQRKNIAVCLPCYNEGLVIARVIEHFRAVLPEADIYVYDNASTDNTYEQAEKAGAIVRRVGVQGKGYVVRRMFADIEADVYVLADGDATYDADSAVKLVEVLATGHYDLVTGCRVATDAPAYRRGHASGNRLLTNVVRMLFGRNVKDMLSGFRVMSRRFVKTFPVLSRGFEIETELTIHALELDVPMSDVDTPYRERQEGSHSKLHTYADGLRILRMVLDMLVHERPLYVFGGFSAALTIVNVALAVPVIMSYFETGLIERFPTAILCMVLFLLAISSLMCGFILRAITHARREMKRLAYMLHSQEV